MDILLGTGSADRNDPIYLAEHGICVRALNPGCPGYVRAACQLTLEKPAISVGFSYNRINAEKATGDFDPLATAESSPEYMRGIQQIIHDLLPASNP